MALIKSSLEIAMERAAALMGQAEDSAKEEGGKHGQAAARRFLSGDVDAAEMAGLVDGRPDNQRKAALSAAVDHLLEALVAGDDTALAGLEALPLGAAGGAEAVAALTKAAQGRFQAAGELYTTLAAEMSRDLAQVGIGGTAVSPNPLSHPQLEQRMRQAMDGHIAELTRAARQLRAVLA